jgi:hypothetical protein
MLGEPVLGVTTAKPSNSGKISLFLGAPSLMRSLGLPRSEEKK